MKLSEKYKVNGTLDNKEVNGEVTIYPNNMNKVPKKSIIAGFRTSLKELQKKFGTISIYNKDKTVRAISLVLAGTITLGSLTGCSLGKKDVTKDSDPIASTTIEEPIKEETKKISYTVELGDSLWSIAKKYCDTDGEIVNEIANIRKLNNLKEKSILKENMILTLEVPVSKLINFGIETENDRAFVEETQRIEYKLRRGDTLWYIAKWYKLTDAEIANEVAHICEINGIETPDELKEGDTIKLDVPLSKLSEFSVTPNVTPKEDAPSVQEKTEYDILDDEWESKSQFIYDSWNNAKNNVHPQNYMFPSNYWYLFISCTQEYNEAKYNSYTNRNNAQENDDTAENDFGVYDGGLFHKAYGERDKLKEMYEIEGLYTEEQIARQKSKIDALYEEMAKITEVNLGTKYNMESYTKGK